MIAASTLGPSPAAIRLRCPSSELALARRSRAVPSDLGGPAYTSAIVGDTAILRVRRFAGDDADLAKLEELPADYAKHRRARRIVFDVRSNGGGDDSTLFKWIFQAAAGPWNQGVTVDFSAGVGPCRDWNALVVGQLVSGEIDGVDAIAERDAALATLTATASDEVLEVDAGLREGRAERPFAGPIFVLVDRGTASSGESVPQYLRLALGARVIGERSAGFVDFGNVVPFVLPRTGLWVQVPTTRFFSGRSAEMVGLEVDTYLDAELMGQPAEALLPVIDAIEAAGAGPRR
ncbi:MAG: S41 family peptidase [Nannocystaceae bacterium]